jgi:hypothetical protein
MPSYAGVSFQIETGSNSFTRTWGRESVVSRRKIPWGNKEDVQFGGKGHWRWNGEIIIDSEADYYTLEAASGDGTGRTLTDFRGDTIAAVRLNSVSEPESDPINAWHKCRVEFEYQS